MSWVLQVFTMEMRKAFSYRVDFWLNLVLGVLGELGVAFFLWRAIFSARGAEKIGGFSFSAMMFYYLLIPLIGQVVRGGERGIISDEIYQGTMTRYLVYPVPVFGYKYVLTLGRMTISLLQLALGVWAFIALFGVPQDVHLSAQSAAMGLVAVLAGAYLYFTISVCLELVAFWQDSVWSLLVMLQFGGMFLGGGLIPFSLFPTGLRRVMEWLPFRMWLDFPVRSFMGLLSLEEWTRSLAISCAWAILFSFLVSVVWKKGTREYTGVGI